MRNSSPADLKSSGDDSLHAGEGIGTQRWFWTQIGIHQCGGRVLKVNG
jgi:hypothetical protein